MSHYRAQWRAAVQAAILASPRFVGMLVVRPWNQNLGAESLPAFSVSTEREDVAQRTKASVQRQTTLVVRLWRNDDGRLDDTLDDDAAEIEPIVLGALRNMAFEVNATGTETMFDGQTRVGMLAVSFAVMRHTPEGLPLIED